MKKRVVQEKKEIIELDLGITLPTTLANFLFHLLLNIFTSMTISRDTFHSAHVSTFVFHQVFKVLTFDV